MIVSHNLTDVFEVADRITVLRLGRNVGVYEKAKTTQQEIVEAITFGTAAPDAGMSSAAPPADVQAPAAEQESIGAILRARWEAFKGGDVGCLPVIIGILAIGVFFTLKTNIFFTAVNFTNLIQQMAGTTVIAIGVVFVLLIGEIDLSIGYVSGLASVTVAEMQLPGSSHHYPGLIAMAIAILVGVACGLVQGSIIAFLGVPSFVVTLAGLLIAEGLIIKIISGQGSIGIQDQQINDVANYVLTKNTGWIVAIVFTLGLAAAAARHLLQPAAGRACRPGTSWSTWRRSSSTAARVPRGGGVQPLPRRPARRPDHAVRRRRLLVPRRPHDLRAPRLCRRRQRRGRASRRDQREDDPDPRAS